MTNSTLNLVRRGQLVILLVAPLYDDLTEYTSGLLDNFPSLGAPTILSKIKRPLTYNELLSVHAIDPLKTDVALIFCGHGKANALEGPGVLDAPNYRAARSIFFDQRHIPKGPKFLLAFCSNAAIELGNSYGRTTTECTFVGFDGDIGLVLSDGEYADCWRKIVHGLASAMLTSTDDRSLEESIRRLYRDAISFFSPKKDQKYKWGLMMRAYLRRQLDVITVIRT